MELDKLLRSVKDADMQMIFRRATKFDAGEVDDRWFDDFNTDNVVRLPYPVMYIEYVAVQSGDLELEEPLHCVTLLGQQLSGQVMVSIFSRNESDEAYVQYPLWVVIDRKGDVTINFDENQKMDAELKELFRDVMINRVKVVMGILERIGLKQVTIVDRKPRGVKSKIKRIAKQYEYKELQLTPWVTRNIQRGTGTHAPPRTHDRRGHDRTLKSGKVVRVRACIVNAEKKAMGMIDKEYKV